MTEYKFGTWYEMEELEEFEKDVLFLRDDSIEIGFRHINSLKWATFRLRDDRSKQVYPLKWMPLPPRPEEE
jgi:hypothetical protein